MWRCLPVHGRSADASGQPCPCAAQVHYGHQGQVHEVTRLLGVHEAELVCDMLTGGC
jgi:hypothetical protein